MSLSRIVAILRQELYITRRSLEVIVDIFFFPLISTIVFALVSAFLFETNNTEAASYILTGTLLWEVIHIAQYAITIGMMWNLWSKNLTNLFISPLTLGEFLIAHILTGTLKAGLFLLVGMSILSYFFHFNLLVIGIPNLLLSFASFILFASATGMVIMGLIFRYGTKISALAWGLIFLFQPLTAAYYPLSVLPLTMQRIALLFPPTYVFEADRAALADPSFINWQYFGISFAENLIYIVLALWFLNVMFTASKKSGQFSRNE